MGTSASTSRTGEKVKNYLDVARRETLPPKARIKALQQLSQLVLSSGSGREATRSLTLAPSLSTLSELTEARGDGVLGATLRLMTYVSNSNNLDFRFLVGQKFIPILVELMNVENVEVRRLVTETLANLAFDENNQDILVECEALPPLVEFLSSNSTEIQLHSTRALAEVASSKKYRLLMLEQGALLPLVALSFVGNLYGLVRYHALRALANLAKEEAPRKAILDQGILSRLAKMGSISSDMIDPMVKHLVASIFSNFSLSEDTTPILASECIPALYTLVFSDSIDYVIEGLWAIANYCNDNSKRTEVIETDGVKLLFSLLKVKEVQIWFEVTRVLLNISAGKDEHRKHLIKEGALEAILTVYTSCTEERISTAYEIKTQVGRMGRMMGGDDDDDDDDQSMYDVVDVEQSARYMTMTVATHALKNLTKFPFAAAMLMEMGGDKPLMSLLRMEFNAEGQQYAAGVLGNLCLNAECCQKLVFEGVIESLVDLVRLSSSTGVHQEAAYALATISLQNDEYQKAIIENDGVSALVGVLKKEISLSVAYHVIRCLSTLHTPEAKHSIIQNGAVPFCVLYVDQIPPSGMSPDEPLRKVAAVLFRNLADMNDDAQQSAMVHDGVLGPLMAILREEKDTELLLLAAQTIATLTIKSDSNKEALTMEPALLQCISTLLQTTDDDLLFHILTIMGNITTVESVRTLISKERSILDFVCRVLLVDQFALNLQAMRALVYLSLNENCARAIPEEVNVSTLMSMCTHSNATLQKHAVNVLANLAAVPEIWDLLLTRNPLDELKQLMLSDNYDVSREAVRATANLSLCKSTLAVFEELNLVSHLCGILKDSVQEKNHTAQVSSFMGARNIKMQVQTLIALKNICRQQNMLLRVVKEFDCLPTFIRLLESNSIDVRREAAGCLAVIVMDSDRRLPFIGLGGREAVMKGLKTSVAITAELDKEIADYGQRLEDDTSLKNIEIQKSYSEVKPGTQQLPQGMVRNLLSTGVGLNFEDREQLMMDIEQKKTIKKQNSGLQTEYCRIIYYLSEDENALTSFVVTWDWNVFMGPLTLTDKESQEWATRMCFRLLGANKKINKFVQRRGVYFVCRALQFEDIELRRIASDTLRRISGADKFQEALINEGGVGLLLALIQSDDVLMLRSTFHAVGLLCNSNDLVQMFDAQGLLDRVMHVYQLYAHQDNELMSALIMIIVNVAQHDRVRKRMFAVGGLDILMANCLHPHIPSLRQVFKALISVSNKDDVRKKIIQNEHLPKLIESLKGTESDCVRDALQVIHNVACKDQYRNDLYSESFIADLVLLLDEARLPEVFQRRREFKKSQGLQVGSPDDVVEDPKAGDVYAACALLAVKVLGAMVSIDEVKKIIVETDRGLGLKTLLNLFKSDNLEPKWQSIRIMAFCCTIPSLHITLGTHGIVQASMVVCDFDNAEIRRQAAKIFALLSETPALHKYFANNQTLIRIKALATSKVRDMQISCSQAFKGLTSDKEMRDLLIRVNILPTILSFLDADHGQLKLNGLIILKNMCKGIFSNARPDDEIWKTTKDLVGGIVAIFRTSPRDSPISVASAEALGAIVSTEPATFGSSLLHGGGMRDIKSLLISRPRKVDGQTTPDCRVPASKVLLAVSEVADNRTTAMATVGMDDLVELLRVEYSDCQSLEFLCNVTMAIGNYAHVAPQRDKLIKIGGLKLLVQLLQLKQVRANYAAAYALAVIAEAYKTTAKILGTASMEMLIGVLVRMVKELNAWRGEEVAGVGAAQISALNEAAHEDPLLPYSMLYELSRLVANLSDAGETAERVLYSSYGDKLKNNVLDAVDYPHVEIRWQVQATLARTHTKFPPPTPTTGQSVSLQDVDSILDALKDRMDLNKVEANTKNLCLLTQRLRAKEGSMPDVAKKVIDRGMVSAFMSFLRTDDIKIFTYAAWILIDMGSEIPEIRRQMVSEGLASIVKLANNVSDPRRLLASKIVVTVMRESMSIPVLKKYKMDMELPRVYS